MTTLARLQNLETYSGSGPLVQGEYNCVARKSRDVEALLLAHAVPLTRDEAKGLARDLAAAYPVVGEHRVIFAARNGRTTVSYRRTRKPVTFADGTPALSYRTGRPRHRLVPVRDGQGELVRDLRVSLPAKPRPAATADVRTFAGLRVGVVLHEFAHAIDYRRSGRMDPHGARFTAILDELVAWWAGHAGPGSDNAGEGAR